MRTEEEIREWIEAYLAEERSGGAFMHGFSQALAWVLKDDVLREAIVEANRRPT